MNAAVRATVRMALYAGARTYAVSWVGRSFVYINHLKSMFSSYRNQSIDLHRKSVYWFLYDRNLGRKWKRWPTLKIFWLHWD